MHGELRVHGGLRIRGGFSRMDEGGGGRKMHSAIYLQVVIEGHTH